MPSPALADDNEACWRCHDGVRELLVQSHPLQAIHRERYAQGVHGRMACRECHTGIVALDPPHQQGTAPKIDCAACHEKRMGEKEARIRRNIDHYRQSFHARPNPDDPTIPNATCHECHDTHFFAIPRDQASPAHAAWRANIPALCGKCHDDPLERYAASIHGVELLEKHNPRAPTCTDCHDTHAITGSHIPTFTQNATETCGKCHPRNLASYRRFYHGQANRLGAKATANCFHCHDSHATRAVQDPGATIHPGNRLKTCQKCHDGQKRPLATTGFGSFTPHAHSDDLNRFPGMWIASRLIHGLTWGVMLFFLIHAALWFRREWRERPHTPRPAPSGRHVRRFPWFWRAAHLLFALTVMTLLVTGMTLHNAHAPWAPVLAKLMGGPASMGWIHRGAALLMTGIFALHLLILVPRLIRDKNFVWFGPDSLLPNRRDFRDCRAMFLWFLGRGEKPRFERWTYYEKFDYWAVFWGMALIGGSGVVLAFPHVAGEHFGGWVFNVALLLHGEEAFLAAVFLFTIHFFNNHFLPSRLPPPETVIFTGSDAEEKLRREHPAYHERLLATHTLERHLVPPPARALVWGAKLLGLLLIGCGLILLVLTLHGALTA
ncbi:MAG: cytochrome C [Magnetococcales bacterium]|nr:cytochrome C [Magnetococcales bacterium]